VDRNASRIAAQHFSDRVSIPADIIIVSLVLEQSCLLPVASLVDVPKLLSSVSNER